MNETVNVLENKIFLDPKSIPLSVKETACWVLNSSIRSALLDPAKKAAYERWKVERGIAE